MISPRYRIPSWRRRQHGRSQLLRAVAAASAVLALAAVGGCGSSHAPTAAAPPPAAEKGWMSGAFLGGQTTIAGAEAFGAWRGRPTRVIEIVSNFQTWNDLVASQGLLDSLKSFDGLVVITVPLLPVSGSAKLADVAAGRHDDVFLELAKQLAGTNRHQTVVRVGPISNLPSVPWAATIDNASTYRAAAHHVMALLKEQVPGLRTEWDIACGRGLVGTIDRTAALTRLYPGDDVTDIVGCVHFDAFGVRALSPQEWAQALRLRTGVGLADVADFARERMKKLAIPDWGLSNEPEGGGDDPTFVTRMHQYFTDNADILAFEGYYDDPTPPRNSALWVGPTPTANPLAAAQYQHLWGLG